MATHSSVLAWRIPGTGEPGRLPSMGSHRVRHDWSDLAGIPLPPPNLNDEPAAAKSLQSCPTARPQPTRLPRPWDSPGKNTGVGCHFLIQCMKVKSESEVSQSCPTLSDPMDYSPPVSSIHGIFQARVLKWGTMSLETVKTEGNSWNEGWNSAQS